MQKEFDYEEDLAKLDAKIKDAEENFGDIEIRDAILQKAHFYKKHNNDKNLAISTYNLALKKTIEIGRKMDINFWIMSIHLEERNLQKIKDIIEECKILFEKGGDWQRKNRLKIYEAIYFILVRDFASSSKLFVEAIPTFNSPQIMSYQHLIFYSVLIGVICMNRQQIKKNLLESSEVTVHLNNMQDLKQFLHSFYYCDYKKFFQKLLWVIKEVKENAYLKNHYRYFMRETRVVIYSQFLQSYKTVTLGTMAREFGVSTNFIDKELSQLIAARRLQCKIDKVSGIIEAERSDERNILYKAALKKGDHLLNRIQKLSRVIDV